MQDPAPTPASPSAEDTFRDICLSAAQAMDAALAVFLETEDQAGPHKARVALRRLTTALDAFLPLLRRKQTAKLRARAKRIFRRLGTVRDSDVLLEAKGRKGASAALIAQNRQLRSTTRDRLRKTRAIGFPQELRLAVMPGGPIYRRSPSAQVRRAAPVALLAADLLETAWDRCRAWGPSVRRIPEDRRHDFRKDMKSLRYLAEFFAGQIPGLQEDPFRSDFRAIQDDLGTVNDHAVSLLLDGARRPARPPPPVAEALARADRLWQQLSASTPPWRAQATRRP